MLSGVAAACRGQFIGNPFPFHDFPSSSSSHSPFNDHGEPVSSLLDRSLRLKARCLSASPHYSPYSGVFWLKTIDLVMGHLVDFPTSDADQEVIGEQTSLLGQAVLDHLDRETGFDLISLC